VAEEKWDCLLLLLFFNLCTAAFKAYCAIWVRRSNFRHQASPCKSTQQQKVELRARNVREFCLNADFHITFRNLLHAVKIQHWTDSFTAPPKEGVLRIFFRPKNPTASARWEPADLDTKRQDATSRPPKPLMGLRNNIMVEEITRSSSHQRRPSCSHISPLSCLVLQYGLEVLFGNAVVLLMCSASSEWAPFIEHFGFEKKWVLGNGMVVASL
jgi:hypothetical protein